MQVPPAYSVQDNAPTGNLPPYRIARSQSEYTFPSPNDYVYNSNRLSLNLGGRVNHTIIPSYGKSATIVGSISVKDSDHVKEISITISGTAIVLVTDSFLGTPLGRDTLQIFRKKVTLWKSSKGAESQPLPTTLPFSIALVSDSPSPLPPSCFARSNALHVAVQYQITADMVRHGFRSHDAAGTQFLYLPRSIPRPPRYLPRSAIIGEDQWEEFGATAKSSSVSSGKSKVQFYLPSPLSYASGTSIPFRVTLSLPPIALTPHVLQSNTTVELLKLVSIQRGTQQVRPLRINLQMGHNYSWELHNGVLEMSGKLDGVSKGSEAAWSVGNKFIDVQYIIRLTIMPTDALPIQFDCEVPVELVTDQPDAFSQRDKESWERPAMGLLRTAGMRS